MKFLAVILINVIALARGNEPPPPEGPFHYVFSPIGVYHNAASDVRLVFDLGPIPSFSVTMNTMSTTMMEWANNMAIQYFSIYTYCPLSSLDALAQCASDNTRATQNSPSSRISAGGTVTGVTLYPLTYKISDLFLKVPAVMEKVLTSSFRSITGNDANGPWTIWYAHPFFIELKASVITVSAAIPATFFRVLQTAAFVNQFAISFPTNRLDALKTSIAYVRNRRDISYEAPAFKEECQQRSQCMVETIAEELSLVHPFYATNASGINYLHEERIVREAASNDLYTPEEHDSIQCQASMSEHFEEFKSHCSNATISSLAMTFMCQPYLDGDGIDAYIKRCNLAAVMRINTEEMFNRLFGMEMRPKRFILEIYNTWKISKVNEDLQQTKRVVNALQNQVKAVASLTAQNAEDIAKLSNVVTQQANLFARYVTTTDNAIRGLASDLVNGLGNVTKLLNEVSAKLSQEIGYANGGIYTVAGLSATIDSMLDSNTNAILIAMSNIIRMFQHSSLLESYADAIHSMLRGHIPVTMISAQDILNAINNPTLQTFLATSQASLLASPTDLAALYQAATVTPMFDPVVNVLYAVVKLPAVRQQAAFAFYNYLCIPAQVPLATTGMFATMECPDEPQSRVAISADSSRYLVIGTDTDGCVFSDVSYCMLSRFERPFPRAGLTTEMCMVLHLLAALGLPADLSQCRTKWTPSIEMVNFYSLPNSTAVGTSPVSSVDVFCANSVNKNSVSPSSMIYITLPPACWVSVAGSILRGPILPPNVTVSFTVTSLPVKPINDELIVRIGSLSQGYQQALSTSMASDILNQMNYKVFINLSSPGLDQVLQHATTLSDQVGASTAFFLRETENLRNQSESVKQSALATQAMAEKIRDAPMDPLTISSNSMSKGLIAALVFTVIGAICGVLAFAYVLWMVVGPGGKISMARGLGKSGTKNGGFSL